MATTTATRGPTEAQLFGLRFFLILALFSVLSWAINLPARMEVFQIGLARCASFIARLFGSMSPLDGHHILVPSITIDINFECTGIYVLLILFTFLLAYPATWEQRLNGALIGLAGMTAINVLRLAFLIRVGEAYPSLFDYFHEYVWQGVFLILVIVYAMAWVERIRAR